MMSLNREKGSRVYVIRNDLPPKERLQLNCLSTTSWDSHLKSPQKKVYHSQRAKKRPPKAPRFAFCPPPP